MPDFDRYQSPFSWRYASSEMRQIWSEDYKRRLWRRIWVALAEVQSDFGLVSPEQLVDLRAHQDQVDIARSLEIEAEIRHDLMAELTAFSEQCPLGGGVLHLGATSMDIEDNADALRMRDSLAILHTRLARLLGVFADRIEQSADMTVLGFTHLQPAEPTTLGYRLSFYAQDLLASLTGLERLQNELRGKGFKGAVGTGAAYADLLGADQLQVFENRLSRALDLPFFTVTSQVYPRSQDFRVVSELAGIGACLHKFAFDLRVLQSPPIGEWSEPFAKKQVGSSAMPFKRNPINAEKINSLARSLSVLPQVAWSNSADSLLERTLDDSANRRSFLPEAFLICDELLLTATRLLEGLVINPVAIQANLDRYAPFSAVERVLMALVRKGASRQEMHEVLRVHAQEAWQVVQSGRPNPLIAAIKTDVRILAWLPAESIEAVLDVNQYTGFATTKALEIARLIRARV